MMLQDFKAEVNRRRNRINVHLKNFHHGKKQCLNKVSHKQYESDLALLQALWQAESLEQVPKEIRATCSNGFLKDLEQYFKLSKEVRKTLCEALRASHHLEHKLRLPNPASPEALANLRKLGLSDFSIQRLFSSCGPQNAEHVFLWTKENLSKYARTTATHPDEAKNNFRAMLRLMRQMRLDEANKKFCSFGLSPINSELQNFDKICDGIRNAIYIISEMEG